MSTCPTSARRRSALNRWERRSSATSPKFPAWAASASSKTRPAQCSRCGSRPENRRSELHDRFDSGVGVVAPVDLLEDLEAEVPGAVRGRNPLHAEFVLE